MCKKKKGRNQGGGVGERERDTELEQQQNYRQQKQSVPHGRNHCVHGAVHSSLWSWPKREEEKEKEQDGRGDRSPLEESRDNCISVLSCSYQVDILLLG